MTIILEAKSRDEEPIVAGTSLTVAEVVKHCYESGQVPAGSASLDLKLSRTDLDDVLDYCASRKCDAAGGRCRACKLWTLEQGIDSLDAYCAQFATIAFAKSGVTVTGGGASDKVARQPTLQALADWWAGEEFWFLARRVIRRLKHKQKQGQKLPPRTPSEPLAPAVVLVEPQMAENIGMVARAMANFSLGELRVVSPRDGWPNVKAQAAAAGAQAIIDEAPDYPNAQDAVADLHWLCATTARPRDMTKPVLTPEDAATEMRRRIGRGERVGVLFGAERSGLNNEQVALADAIVMAPVNPQFASLNLAQAVLLFGYEWLKQGGSEGLGRETTFDGPGLPGLNLRKAQPATKAEFDAFMTHMENELTQAGFLYPPEKRPIMVRNLRNMFMRMGATDQEIRTLRGVIVALVDAKKSPRRVP